MKMKMNLKKIEPTNSSDEVSSPKNKKSFFSKKPSVKGKLLDFTPTELAHQLTLISFESFKNIKPLELYTQSWSKQNSNMLSPNVIEMISHFNRISQWIACEVVSQTVLKKRALILKHFISVAWAVYNYRDYENTFAVVLGLSQLSISRLSETWKNLENSSKSQWRHLQDFTNFRGNYKKYRHEMKNLLSSSKIFSGKNVLPYLGLYLKDLTSLEENSSYNKQMGAVNFYKMRMVASVITEIQKAQQSIFNFNKNLNILSYLTYEIPLLDEEAIWNMSKKCEVVSSEDATDLKGSLSKAKEVEVVKESSNPIFGIKKVDSKSSPKSSSKSPLNVVKKLVSKFEKL